jgi:hypothetical protein
VLELFGPFRSSPSSGEQSANELLLNLSAMFVDDISHMSLPWGAQKERPSEFRWPLNKIDPGRVMSLLTRKQSDNPIRFSGGPLLCVLNLRHARQISGTRAKSLSPGSLPRDTWRHNP